ncbi:RFC checkpoint protein Rad17 [Sporothrix epigloea]|uniref:RFC checkpoint protein Rad17 n=1 Tax=Sporothrix epigloea TaxID=1892477 RepID=A0ABP0DZS3_9PEZI
MPVIGQSISVFRRTYRTRQYVFSCGHTTVRDYGVKGSITADTAFSTTAVVPFLMPIRVDHICVTCVRFRLVNQLDEKVKDVRVRFTSLCHGLEAIAKESEKLRNAKRCKKADPAGRIVDDNDDKQVQRHESWEDQPLPLSSLLSSDSKDKPSALLSDEYTHLCLSDKIRKLRWVLERCKRTGCGAPASAKAASADAGVNGDNVVMAKLARTSDGL